MERGNIFYREIIMEYPSKICSTSELNLITKNIFKNVLKEELLLPRHLGKRQVEGGRQAC